MTEENKNNVEDESTELLEELRNLDHAEEASDVDKLLKEALKEKERFQSIAQRAQADLVNYRSRVIQEQEELRRTVKSGVLTRFIGIIDDLERAINEANNYDGPVIVDFVIEKVDYVYPMIPAGGSVDQLIEEEKK